MTTRRALRRPVGVGGLVLLAILSGGAAVGAPPLGAPAPATGAPTNVEVPAHLPDGWYARVETTLGAFWIRLLPEQAPQSVAHFAALAEGKLPWTDVMGQQRTGPYYDGITVHKVVFGQRFEAGDPTGTGRGAPPIYVPAEVDGPVKFARPYRVGMTRSPMDRTSGALFFVTVVPAPEFNGDHPCFGQILAGQEVVDRITDTPADAKGRPLEPVTLRSVRVVKKGGPPPLPEPVPYVPNPPSIAPRARPDGG